MVRSATASTGSFDTATGIWTIAELAAGGAATLTVQTGVTAGGTLTNRVEVTSSTPDAAAARAGVPGAPMAVASTASITATQPTVVATGADSDTLTATAAILVFAGLVLMVGSRRRRQPLTPATRV